MRRVKTGAVSAEMQQAADAAREELALRALQHILTEDEKKRLDRRRPPGAARHPTDDLAPHYLSLAGPGIESEDGDSEMTVAAFLEAQRVELRRQAAPSLTCQPMATPPVPTHTQAKAAPPQPPAAAAAAAAGGGGGDESPRGGATGGVGVKMDHPMTGAEDHLDKRQEGDAVVRDPTTGTFIQFKNIRRYLTHKTGHGTGCGILGFPFVVVSTKQSDGPHIYPNSLQLTLKYKIEKHMCVVLEQRLREALDVLLHLSRLRRRGRPKPLQAFARGVGGRGKSVPTLSRAGAGKVGPRVAMMPTMSDTEVAFYETNEDNGGKQITLDDVKHALSMQLLPALCLPGRGASPRIMCLVKELDQTQHRATDSPSASSSDQQHTVHPAKALHDNPFTRTPFEGDPLKPFDLPPPTKMGEVGGLDTDTAPQTLLLLPRKRRYLESSSYGPSSLQLGKDTSEQDHDQDQSASDENESGSAAADDDIEDGMADDDGDGGSSSAAAADQRPFVGAGRGKERPGQGR
ncbi:unnamed protein product [Vitrella brassicaformis CCMP3155]|uniref:Uncharacterized protein n=1 Tax=Vitrella brassicaformis (strain CCMP3155) TaxID=1169540 RepID=A0A0G4FC61_VITBC|nr:unnamed protein product [Vitrella brassicaformis CCMP3155]|eukprot:CEM10232.1 unnamed protein product [Vitrella brassicaformis CCMP3155]